MSEKPARLLNKMILQAVRDRLYEMMAEEVESLCGPRMRHQTEGEVCLESY